MNMNQLAEVPGVACGIQEKLNNNLNLKKKLNFEFSLCYPKGTYGFLTRPQGRLMEAQKYKFYVQKYLNFYKILKMCAKNIIKFVFIVLYCT